jgi:hypothetical protein
MDDLTQRLREGVVTSTYDGFVVIDPPTALTREAAARIEALEAEVARLRGALEEIAEYDTGATAGLAYTARAALTPPHVQHTAGVDATAPTSGC